MDYKKLIEELRSTDIKTVMCCSIDAADSIETLLAERDAAIKDLKRVCDDNPDVCQYCKHMPCTDNNGKCIGWEWRGVDGK